MLILEFRLRDEHAHISGIKSAYRTFHVEPGLFKKENFLNADSDFVNDICAVIEKHGGRPI